MCEHVQLRAIHERPFPNGSYWRRASTSYWMVSCPEIREMDNELKFLIEPSDYCDFYSAAVVGRVVARRDLRHRFWSRFGYTTPLPTELSSRTLIASESDDRGRREWELREWDSGLVDISTEYEAGAGKLIRISGFFPTREAADLCFRRLCLVLPPEVVRPSGMAAVTFWNQSSRRDTATPERESRMIKVPT